MKKVILAASMIVLVWSSQAVAAELKVAAVDIKTSMESTKAYGLGIKRLEALQNKKKSQLEALRKRVTDLDKELQLQSMALSNERQSEKEQELATLKKDFERKLQDATDELKAEKRQLDSKLIGKFYDAVRAYGKDKKYDLIVPKSTTMYISDSLDITAEITKILDREQ